MRFSFRALVASLIAVMAISSAGASAHPRKHHPKRQRLVLPADYAAWSRVATCEEGGWNGPGGNYPDALGIDRVNYAAFGGQVLKPGPVSLQQRVVEIRVADRLIRHYGVGIPDQGSHCAAW